MSKRTTSIKPISNSKELKKQLAFWGNSHDVCLILDSNAHKNKYSSFDFLIAIGAESQLELKDSPNAFVQLNNYYNKTKDSIFGYLSYDLKNDLENLSSKNKDLLAFPELFFFQAKKIIKIKGNKLEFSYLTKYSQAINTDFETLKNYQPTTEQTNKLKPVAQIDKADYLKTIQQIKADIQQGKYYEINYCHAFTSSNASIKPLAVYHKLNALSQAPFASYLKNKNNYSIGSSPERFIKKTGTTIISQPIKGTAKRGKNDAEDAALKLNLAEDSKERAENIMIVDLVRNDMAKIAQKGSVSVPELCQIYTFDQVHQMISTVSCEVSKNMQPVRILKNMFPMGSMTGAPKLAAMQYIEQYENNKRGLYSGAIGYITASGDFDFNVVIRSILYNKKKQKLAFMVGGAITALSDAETEYQECLTKAKALFEALS